MTTPAARPYGAWGKVGGPDLTCSAEGLARARTLIDENSVFMAGLLFPICWRRVDSSPEGRCGLGPVLHWKAPQPPCTLRGSTPAVWPPHTVTAVICQLKPRRHELQLTPRGGPRPPLPTTAPHGSAPAWAAQKRLLDGDPLSPEPARTFLEPGPRPRLMS